jgi:hypothetical protein
MRDGVWCTFHWQLMILILTIFRGHFGGMFVEGFDFEMPNR